ncbi:hypothetical protein [Rothia nasimurium]|uniref:hypothetical protein n=1 Tax=Rothia nasimurium TaxID=85336 RepID=UPI001F199BF5|nr:hypothetical protein [Rothia nasimurium]
MTEKQRNGAIITIIGLSVLSLLFAVYTLWPKQDTQDEAPTATATTSTSAAPASPSPTSTAENTADDIAEGSCTDPATVDRSDAEELIKGFTEIAFCWDSTTDPNTTAALLRAQPLLTEDYYKSLDPNVRNAMSADFLAVSKSKAYTLPVVSFAPEETEEMPEGFIAKDVIVEWTWLGRDGYEYKGGRSLATVAAVEEEPGKWAISGMQINSTTSETGMLYGNTNQ